MDFEKQAMQSLPGCPRNWQQLRWLERRGVESFRRELDSKHPIGHVGDPDDIAYGIVYLASDEAKFLTGSELVIDGGYTAQ